MEFGYLTLNHVGGIGPGPLAAELEARGFDSIWLGEHSHIPADRTTGYPAGGELPDGYVHGLNPFVSLAVAAAATTSLTLATGVCLLLEHDLLDLASTVASLDVLSNGRVLFGVGVGWNREELANHRPDIRFEQRYSAMRERVEALRVIWTADEPEFDGRWDRFTTSWIEPKPVQRPLPIALGNAGRVGIEHAATYADHWCPLDAQLLNDGDKPDVRGAIEMFRNLVAEHGRDPATVPISIFAFGRMKRSRLDSYQALGVDRIVALPPSMSRHDESVTMRWLDELSTIMDEMR
ncbi:MAG: TIGR03619 family F420-dependent LLM class oxidoreductase [Ilumatobacteraceae bacterium]